MASGKDASKKYLEEKYGAVSFRFSSILREALDLLGIEQNRDNLITISVWARQNFGEDLLAKAMAKKVEKSDQELVIIDGARRLSDLIYLKKLPGFHLIAIEATPEIRYQRSVSRNENPGDAEKSYETFLADHEKETEKTIPETMAQAEFKIDNSSSLEELQQQLEEIIKKVGL
jgi:dephospho-CoA kinase